MSFLETRPAVSDGGSEPDLCKVEEDNDLYLSRPSWEHATEEVPWM